MIRFAARAATTLGLVLWLIAILARALFGWTFDETAGLYAVPADFFVLAWALNLLAAKAAARP